MNVEKIIHTVHQMGYLFHYDNETHLFNELKTILRKTSGAKVETESRGIILANEGSGDK